MARGHYVDIAGQTFGRLRVITRAPDRIPGRPRWQCECSCGKTHIAEGAGLRKGLIRSCGCLRRELSAERIRRGGEKVRQRNRVLAAIFGEAPSANGLEKFEPVSKHANAPVKTWDNADDAISDIAQCLGLRPAFVLQGGRVHVLLDDQEAA